jgi:hypothetical protein
MKKATIIGFVLCALVGIAPLSATIFDARSGGTGDYTVQALCRPRESDYLVGFAFRWGEWMDQIQPICAPLESAIQFGGKRHLKPRGGNGGAPSEHYCADDEVITAIKAFVQYPRKVVNGLNFVCSSIKTWATHTIGLGINWIAHDTIADYYNECPRGEVASGIQVSYGKYVNAIGFICDKFRVPKAGEGGSSSNFVAVAGDQKGHWTISVGYSAQTKASAAAMTACGSGCKILHENQAKCVAVAESQQSPAVWGITSANTLDEAKSGALAGCDKQAPGQCKIVDNSRCG